MRVRHVVVIILTVIASIVGAVAATSIAALPADAQPQPVCPTKGRVVCVTMSARRIEAFDNGVLKFSTTDVRFGAAATPTPTGTFRVTRLHPAWMSPHAKGGTPDMRWSVFTSAGREGGIAFHQSAGYPPLGRSYRAARKVWLAGGSHGCVNMGPVDAENLYRLVAGWVGVDAASGGVAKSRVVVVIAA